MNLPRNNQIVLLRWKRRSMCTDGKKSFQGEWEEFVDESRFIVKWYENEGSWIKVDGGWFSLPRDMSGHENEVIEWIGFDKPDAQEARSNAYKQELIKRKALAESVRGKLTQEEIDAIRTEPLGGWEV